MNLGEDLQKDLLKASQADFKTLVKTVIYWIDEAYTEGYGNGYIEAGGKGLMDENGPVEIISRRDQDELSCGLVRKGGK